MSKRYDVTEIHDWEPVEVFGKRCILTSCRVNPKSLPHGFYMYECRHYDEDWGLICEIAPGIMVNFFGTIVVNEPLPVDWDTSMVSVRNGDNQYGEKVIDGEWECVDVNDCPKEISDVEPIAHNWNEYMNSTVESHWNIPDECVIQDPTICIIDIFNDTTIDTLLDVTDIFSRNWKIKIVVNIKDMTAKQINLIREVFNQNKNYIEQSAFYEQEHLVWRCRPLEIEEINKRKSLREAEKYD